MKKCVRDFEKNLNNKIKTKKNTYCTKAKKNKLSYSNFKMKGFQKVNEFKNNKKQEIEKTKKKT